jgi:hypothetical protein
MTRTYEPVHSDATILAALRAGESARDVYRRLGCTWERVKTLAIAHGMYPPPKKPIHPPRVLRKSYSNKGRRYVGDTRVPDDWHVVAVEYDGDKITMMKGEVNE